MDEEFNAILKLRDSIQAATNEMKDRLELLHESKGVGCVEKPVQKMGISELVLYVNYLEGIATLVGK